MKPKLIVTALLLVFVGVSVVYLMADEFRKKGEPEPTADVSVETATPTDTAAAAEAGKKVIVYYFHGFKRCRTCLTIEAYTKEAVETGFSEELASGKIEWKVVNIEFYQNEHFVEDYKLSTRSVVLVEKNNGVEQKWDNLEKVWELVGDKDEFIDYVQENTNAFLGNTSD